MMKRSLPQLKARAQRRCTVGGALFATFLSGLALHGQSVDELKVAHHSSFDVQNTARNPFWPVGWMPTNEKRAAPGVKVSSTAWFRKEAFTISSISTGGLPLAMINGRPYGEGDFINMPGGSVQVSQIRDGIVQLRFEGRALEVGLRREAPKAPPSSEEAVRR